MSAWSELMDELDYWRDQGDEKKTGSADDGEPTGLLTHHPVHDPGCRAFIRRFVNEISTHPAACWISARNAFGVAA
jgi:hypothetical protein